MSGGSLLPRCSRGFAPSQRIHRRSPIGATYDAFDSERYVLTFENKAFRDLAANAPYDVVEILVNSATCGGGGIFGLLQHGRRRQRLGALSFRSRVRPPHRRPRRRVLHVGCRVSAA